MLQEPAFLISQLQFTQKKSWLERRIHHLGRVVLNETGSFCIRDKYIFLNPNRQFLCRKNLAFPYSYESVVNWLKDWNWSKLGILTLLPFLGCWWSWWAARTWCPFGAKLVRSPFRSDEQTEMKIWIGAIELIRDQILVILSHQLFHWSIFHSFNQLG